MNLSTFILTILCAIAFGFIIGAERQITGHSAGIRINVLISFGACLFAMFSQIMGVADTTRIAAQVVTGIGFLCSGIIFKEGLSVRGLNTAATMWCTAAIGVLTSSGHLLFAFVAVVILVGSNILFRFISSRIRPLAHFDYEENSYILSVTCSEEHEFSIRTAIISHLSKAKILLTNLESADEIGNKVEIEAHVLVCGQRRDEHIEMLTTQIALQKGVTKSGWEMV